MNTILNVKNLSVTFDAQKVVQDVSFALKKGEYLALVGPNGAGKSTLLKTIINDNRKFVGSLSFCSDIKLGYVAQKNSDDIYFPATVKEVIKSGFKQNFFSFRLNRQEKEFFQSVVSELNLSSLLKKSFYSLSGGQKRAVLIARALCTGSDLLILDEPASGLDNIASSRLYEAIRTVRNKFNTAIIMVGHDINRLCAEADSILCLEHSVKFIGKSTDFIKTPIYRELMEHLV
ncbi:metal ABC transporter ATP-binding protein [Succinivibrio sp.]|uniref:metal ABC transporter ATP-binding protein n=1 Tax=Succinivibrio sp. TaxID=2053619 RepID=UPI002586FD33|nr:metal ABC transporter ATP-binding protein [Succinivibrio sp.]MDD6205713.1 metal ABC transporter ATP-binding protein [Succinivibrio sp.]